MGTPSIAQLIRHARKAQGLTLEDLAEKVGLTPGALSHIESGRRLPSPKNAVLIAQALGLDEQELMFALDEAHRERRYDSLSEKKAWAASSSASPREPSYRKRDINELFGVEPPLRMQAAHADTQSLESLRARDTAWWAEDPTERVRALDELAETASKALRTLRGLLDDEDPMVRREARRLLRELDVRLPEE